jgi:hypothetical protein
VADEHLRRRLLGAPYSNAELERALVQCQSLGIDTTLYFAAVPQETEPELAKSLQWQRELGQRFGCRLICAPLEIEPYAPWALEPNELGLQQPRTRWSHFVRRHGPGATLGVSHAREVGYDFPGVDARLIRVASAGLDPRVETGRALAFCGQPPGDACALVRPGRVGDLATLLAERAGTPLTLVVHEADHEACSDIELADALGEFLGPLVRLCRLRASAVRHLKTDGQRAPRDRGDGTLTVLHVRDRVAAERVFGKDGWPIPFLNAGVVMAEACRWTGQPCPATRPGLLAWGRDGSVRCCPSAPDLREAPLKELRRKLAALAAETEARRDCSSCPARNGCARCLFTGTLSEEEYCGVRKSWAAQGWHVEPSPEPTGSTRTKVSIGWDD